MASLNSNTPGHDELRAIVWETMRCRGWAGMSALDVRHCVEAQMGLPMDGLARRKEMIVEILAEREGNHDFGYICASSREWVAYLVAAVLVGNTLYSRRAPVGLLNWVWLLVEGAFWWYMSLTAFGIVLAAVSGTPVDATDEQMDETYARLFPDSAEGRRVALERWRQKKC